MKLAVLFSGGKDSNFALFKASKIHEIVCLITLVSQNSDSYMFQTPGNEFIDYQAEALQIPLLKVPTKGEKEEELQDLRLALEVAKEKYKIEGIVTGAIKSAYQSSRIQKICNELDLHCFNPLWQIDEQEYLRELLKNSFEIKIIAIASYPFDKRYLGITINETTKENLLELSKKYQISAIGEGGEFETFVTNSPLFTKRLILKDTTKDMESENCGKLTIKEIEFKKK